MSSYLLGKDSDRSFTSPLALAAACSALASHAVVAPWETAWQRCLFFDVLRNTNDVTALLLLARAHRVLFFLFLLLVSALGVVIRVRATALRIVRFIARALYVILVA
jgi:hypothetical protein